jgi:hypothetical protein
MDLATPISLTSDLINDIVLLSVIVVFVDLFVKYKNKSILKGTKVPFGTLLYFYKKDV